MSSGPTTLNQIIQQAIAQTHALVDIVNANAVNYYKLRKATIIKNNETNPPGIPPAPLPDTPFVWVVNEAAIASGEQPGAYATFDFKNALIPMKYIDPDPAPQPIPDGSDVVIDTAHPFAPGLCRTLSGNPHYLPLHFIKEQDGHKWTFEDSPMVGPYWQQVG